MSEKRLIKRRKLLIVALPVYILQLKIYITFLGFKSNLKFVHKILLLLITSYPIKQFIVYFQYVNCTNRYIFVLSSFKLIPVLVDTQRHFLVPEIV